MGYQPPYNNNLCVLPGPADHNGETESQYEAFLSIYSGTMAGDLYNDLCKTNNITLHELDPGKRGRVGKKKLENDMIQSIKNNANYAAGSSHIIVIIQEETHYKAYVKGKKLYDPYDFWQSPDTHGFCQTFAFYLALKFGNNPHKVSIPSFEIVDDPKRGKELKIFNKYVCNSAKCGSAIIEYITNNVAIKNTFNRQYAVEINIRNKHTFKDKAPVLDTYFKDWLSISTHDAVKYFIYTNDLPRLLLKVPDEEELYITNNNIKCNVSHSVSHSVAHKHGIQKTVKNKPTGTRTGTRTGRQTGTRTGTRTANRVNTTRNLTVNPGRQGIRRLARQIT